MATMLTTEQLAARWGIAPKTLHNWRHTGGGPPFVKIGRAVRYRADAIDRWLAERTFTRTHEPVA